MNTLVIDFETYDPYISRGLGSGWVYKYRNIKNQDFKVLGMAYKLGSGNPKYMINGCTALREYLLGNRECVIIAHNAQYDLGCLKALGYYNKEVPVYDTEVMAKLYDSSLSSYSLDHLAKVYLKEDKDNQGLIDAVWKADIYPWLQKEIAEKKRAEKKGEEYVRQQPLASKLEKWIKSNMDIVQEHCYDAVAKYAKQDVSLTVRLFEFFRTRVDMELAAKYSRLAHVCIDYRSRGVRVDLKKARENVKTIVPVIEQLEKDVQEEAGKEFNPYSSEQSWSVLKEKGYVVQKTVDGNPSVTTGWLERQGGKLPKMIIDLKKHKKILNDFILHIIDIQKYTVDDPSGDYGRVFPELNMLRARTGRFSMQGPNLQQIPSRDKVLGKMCRSMFVAEEGETWYSLDYSNQEGRLQIHYAKLLGCDGAVGIVGRFKLNPQFDMHQYFGDKVGVDRFTAKTINLGLSYGMGIGKLAHQLQISESEARAIKKDYLRMVPYLKQLSQCCETVIKSRGFIRTIGGRRLDNEPGYEYKALNKLIQGSAADQTSNAMLEAFRQGVPVLFPVHDELNMSTKNEPNICYYDITHSEELRLIMEKSIDMEVPVVVDCNHGNSWGDCK